MGQGYSLLTGSLDPLPGYAPRALNPEVDCIFAPMPSATASDGDFTEATVDRSPSTASSYNHRQLTSDDGDAWNISQYDHSWSTANADVIERRIFRDHFQQRSVAASPPSTVTPQKLDAADVATPSNYSDHLQTEPFKDTVAAATNRMSSSGRQFIKRSDNQQPAATTSQSHHRTSIERCIATTDNNQSAAVDIRRTSQLTENLKNNLERLLQRSLNQQQTANRNHLEDHPSSRRLQRIAGGLHADKLNKTVQQTAPNRDNKFVRTDCDLLDGEIIDLQQFAPAESSQASQVADTSVSK
jgi:hypothetical protein